MAKRDWIQVGLTMVDQILDQVLATYRITAEQTETEVDDEVVEFLSVLKADKTIRTYVLGLILGGKAPRSLAEPDAKTIKALTKRGLTLERISKFLPLLLELLAAFGKATV